MTKFESELDLWLGPIRFFSDHDKSENKDELFDV